MTMPPWQGEPLKFVIRPPSTRTRRIVTLGASTTMLAFCSSRSSTTAPAFVTCRSVVRVWAGTQFAGTPVVAGDGKPPVDGGAVATGATATGGPVVAVE